MIGARHRRRPTETAHVKDRQRKHWDAVADGWAAWFDWTERNFAPLTEWLRDAAPWRAGSRVLDVACGAGYPALAAARAVQPGGRVVATDLSRQMIDVAWFLELGIVRQKLGLLPHSPPFWFHF